MRMSDWSSDVCSSDLRGEAVHRDQREQARQHLVVGMQRVMQDRGVGVAVEGDVGAQAGLQAEIAEGGGASDEGIEEAVAITLQLDAAGLQIVDRNFVAQPRCQQRFALRIGENGVFEAEGDVGKAVFVVQHFVEVGIRIAVFGRNEAETLRQGKAQLESSKIDVAAVGHKILRQPVVRSEE